MSNEEYSYQPDNTNGVAPQGAPVPPPAPVMGEMPGQVPPYAQTPPPAQPYGQPQPQYAYVQPNAKQREAGFGSTEKQKWPAAILAYILGPLGIHKFYMGYKTEGLILLLIGTVGVVCFGLGPLVARIISIIEAVKITAYTEEDFKANYIDNYKGWM